MDFLNPDDEARKATLEYCDVQALFQFHRFQRERQSDVVMPEKPRERCARLAALYPNVSFRPSEKSQFIAQVKSKARGALIEHLGFIHHGISYLTTTLSFNYDSVQVAFRADGLGIIKEETWYEFFDHELDLAQVRQECAEDEHALHDALDEYFREHVGPNLEDPFFEPGAEDCALYFEYGSEEELKRLLTLCLLTKPDIAAHAGEDLHIFAATEADAPYLSDYDGHYNTRRLDELLAVVLRENQPIGWSFEYNDGIANRQSGYSENAECLCWNVGELLEHCSARERMAARRELRDYLAARKLDLARFDALAIKTEKGGSPYESLAASVYAHGG